MQFPKALNRAIEYHEIITRKARGTKMSVYMVDGPEDLPFLRMVYDDDSTVPWLLSQVDIFADDWKVIV